MSKKNETHIMKKEDFLLLFDDSISVRKHGQLLEQVTERFSYIVQTLFEINNVKLDWFDYDNAEQDRDINGKFDPNEYDNDTRFMGAWSYPEKIVNPSLEHGEFPNAWYYMDFEEGLKVELEQLRKSKEEKKIQDKQKREENKVRATRMKEQIIAKLTKEELRYVKFK